MKGLNQDAHRFLIARKKEPKLPRLNLKQSVVEVDAGREPTLLYV